MILKKILTVIQKHLLKHLIKSLSNTLSNPSSNPYQTLYQNPLKPFIKSYQTPLNHLIKILHHNSKNSHKIYIRMENRIILGGEDDLFLVKTRVFVIKTKKVKVSPRPDFVVCSFPCKSFSLCGKRQGH